MGALHDLSQSECRALLGDCQVGRVAVVAPDGPHIITVNYALVDEAVIFRTNPYTMLGTYGRAASIAFEVDQIDDASRAGWSVLARGRTEVVFDARQIAQIRKIWDPSPWADGIRNLYLRLRFTELSGRRVGDIAVTAPLL